MRSSNLRSALGGLAGDTRGANLVEYIILVGTIALVAIAAFRFFGTSVRGKVDQQSMTVRTIEVGSP